MRLGTIRPAAGATKDSKRRGKGTATGVGGTSGRGHKGHKARTGGKIPVWFEGGQMPIQRRLPKRGFTNVSRVEYQVVPVGRLAEAPAGTTVDRTWLAGQRIVRRSGPIKLLAGGELKVALTVQVDAASEAARKAVEAAGGKVVTPAPPRSPKTESPRDEDRKADSPRARSPKDEDRKADSPRARSPKDEDREADSPRARSPKDEDRKAYSPRDEDRKAASPKPKSPKDEDR